MKKLSTALVLMLSIAVYTQSTSATVILTDDSVFGAGTVIRDQGQ